MKDLFVTLKNEYDQDGVCVLSPDLVAELRVDTKRAIGVVPVAEAKPTFLFFFTMNGNVYFKKIKSNKASQYACVPVSYSPAENAFGVVPYAPNVMGIMYHSGVGISGTAKLGVERCDNLMDEVVYKIYKL